MGKTPGKFLEARMRRLFPLFWACLATTSAVALYLQQAKMTVSLPQIAVNATMNPTLLGVGFVDGAYWTLEYEWVFYFVVFLAIGLTGTKWIEWIFGGWFLVIVISSITPVEVPLVPDRFVSGICVIFLNGAAAGMAAKHGWTWWRMAAFLTTGAYSLWAVVTGSVDRFDSAAGPIITGLILLAGTIFVGLNTWEPLARVQILGSRMMGRLTYPIYLLHAHLGYMTLNLFATEENKYILLPVMIVALIGLASLYLWLVEDKLADFWRGFFRILVEKPVDAFFGLIKGQPIQESR